MIRVKLFAGSLITMSSRQYRFVTHWRVYGTAEEVFAVLSDPGALTSWWPSVYLALSEIEPGDTDGVGRTLALLTRGWLPYTLGWILRVAQVQRPHSLTIEAQGDLEGRGIWTLEQNGAWVSVAFEWKVDANKPLLRVLAPLFRPVLAANHRWAMAKGQESLSLELARRRAAPAERDAIAPPPPRHSGLLLAAGAGGLLALGIALARLRRPPRKRFGWPQS